MWMLPFFSSNEPHVCWQWVGESLWKCPKKLCRKQLSSRKKQWKLKQQILVHPALNHLPRNQGTSLSVIQCVCFNFFVCVWVCVCVYAYMHVCVYLKVCVYAWLSESVCVCVHTSMCTCLHTCMPVGLFFTCVHKTKVMENLFCGMTSWTVWEIGKLSTVQTIRTKQN